MSRKKKALLFFIALAALSSIAYASFEADQILLKVLISGNSLISRDLKLTNTGTEATNIYISQKGLNSLAIINKSVLRINPGDYGLASILFLPSYRGIENLPGVYAGSIILSNSEIKKIPVVVEIESEDKTIDLNINFQSQLNRIYQDEEVDIEIRIFNLKSTNPANAKIEYFIKDFNGNIILTEEEEVIVKGQISFIKSFNLPADIQAGNYVFAAKIVYEGSVGTSSYSFTINKSGKIKKISEISVGKIYYFIPTLIIAVLILIFTKKVKASKKRNRELRKKLTKKLDLLEEAFKSGFIAQESYSKDKRKIEDCIRKLG